MCPCAAFPESEDAEKELASVISQYHELTHNLVNSGKYDTRDDFTVVMQPFMEGFEVPILPNGDVDFSYFAPDCFHFSAKSHGKIKFTKHATLNLSSFFCYIKLNSMNFD